MAENKPNKKSNERSEYFQERAGTDEARFHVIPYGEEEWAVKTEGKEKPDNTFSYKFEAVDEAKKLAKEAGTMAVIHNEDGQIEEQHNYQN